MTPSLSHWINKKHLEKEAIASIQNIPPEEYKRGIILDDFLLKEKADAIFHFVEEEAKFEDHYKIKAQQKPVEESVFSQTPDKERFLSRLKVSGAKEAGSMSKNWLIYTLLLNFCEKDLPRYLEAVTGDSLFCSVQMTYSHTHEHFIRRHSDYKPERKICLVLYLSKNWQKGDGGELVMEDDRGNAKSIENIYNRLVIFQPNEETMHYVKPHSEQGKEKNRICHVAWFHEKPL